jgi:N-acetylglutamate synthase-like GNAT family acetyltransferase
MRKRILLVEDQADKRREKAVQYFQKAGFSGVQVNELSHDLQNYYYVCRP